MVAPAHKIDALSEETVTAALSHIDHDNRDTWVRMAMAIKSEFGEAGFAIWDNWGQKSKSYNSKDAQHVWKSCKAGGKTGIGTLIHEAISAGFRFDSSTHAQISPEEAEARRVRREREAQEAQAKLERDRARARDDAQRMYAAAIAATAHPYLTRKGITPVGAVRVGTYRRWVDGGYVDIPDTLMLPVTDPARTIVNLQAIFPDADNPLGRDRDYLPGGQKQGCYFSFGGKPTAVVVVCEGYATGASIQMATGLPCMVAFDRTNLAKVAAVAREKFPDVLVVIAADNDQWVKGNPGVTNAMAAANEVPNCRVAVPQFVDVSSEPTDFNDLHDLEGLDAVARQIRAVVDGSVPAPAPANDNVAEPLGDLTSWLLTTAKIKVQGCDAEDGIWLTEAGQHSPKHLKASQLMRKATLLGLMPKNQLEDLVLKANQGDRFTAEAAASALIMAAKENGVYVPPDTRPRRGADALTGVQGYDSAIFARKMQDLTIFDVPSQAWYRWDTVWRRINEEAIRKVIVTEADRDLASEFENKYVNGTLALLKTRLARVADSETSLAEDIWENDRNLLPMGNGILDLTTNELMPHSPDFMFNWMIPHHYNPDAECPVTQQFIHRLAGGDPSTEAVLYAFLAAVLHGRYDLERYLEFVGMAGTGKSTYISLCRQLVGAENVHSTDMRTLHNNQFETANIYGKRLVMISDADKYGGDVGIFKSMTGRDVVRREEKNRQAQRGFIYKGMVIIASNNPVQFADTSTAMARRRVPVHIDKKLDKTEVDYQLAEKLAEEIPGLINQLLSVSQREITEVLSDTRSHRHNATMRALVETNAIAAWANECLVADADASAPVGRLGADAEQFLYPSFAKFCEQTGRKGVVALNTFTRSMHDVLGTAGVTVQAKRKAAGVYITGVRLRRADGWDESIPHLLMP